MKTITRTRTTKITAANIIFKSAFYTVASSLSDPKNIINECTILINIGMTPKTAFFFSLLVNWSLSISDTIPIYIFNNVKNWVFFFRSVMFSCKSAYMLLSIILLSKPLMTYYLVSWSIKEFVESNS